MTIYLILFVAVGGIFIGLSIPLIKRKIPPNLWYGFRVRRTLSDADVWYPANEYAGWRLLWVGAATMTVATIAYCVPNVPLSVYATLVTATTVIGLSIALGQSFLWLAKLPRDDKKNPTDSENVA